MSDDETTVGPPRSRRPRIPVIALVTACAVTLAIVLGLSTGLRDPDGSATTAAVDDAPPSGGASSSPDVPPPLDVHDDQAGPQSAWPAEIPLPDGATPEQVYAAKLTYSLVSVPSTAADAVRAATDGSAITISARADGTDLAVPNERVDAVRAVAPDAQISANSPAHVSGGDQTPTPSWGLDAVDSEFAAQNNHYVYDTTGAGVTAYVIDTGLRMDHPDFAGRVDAGADFVRDGYGTWDCWGHGTHVSGTIAGTTYGVAKSVRVVPVRVFGCKNGSGGGTYLDIYSGLSWVLDNRSPHMAVINMSLGVGQSDQFDAAVRRGVEAGFIIVDAAGNDHVDGCPWSPTSSPYSISVGATASGGSLASFSNFGPCVDILAPGNWIVSDSWPKWTSSMYGTSMASPHVAGLAARLLEIHPDWHSSDVMDFFRSTGAVGRIRGVPSGTVNLFANIPAWPRVLKVTAAVATEGSADIAWTTNDYGVFTPFSVTVTDQQSGRSFPVTITSRKRSTRFSFVSPGHSYTVVVSGGGFAPGGQAVPYAPVSTTFSSGG